MDLQQTREEQSSSITEWQREVLPLGEVETWFLSSLSLREAQLPPRPMSGGEQV
jgi:hypothetical protein